MNYPNPALAGRRLVIFDLDGTLIDSAPDIHAALNRTLAHYGRAPVALSECRMMIGDGAQRLVERALAVRPGDPVGVPEAVAHFLEIYERESAILTSFYPGVRETLDRLRAAGVRLALCTNKPRVATGEVLKAFGLQDHFEARMSGGDQGFNKPDPRMITAILDRLGIGLADAFYVGDSEVDLQTAAAAKLPFVLMTYGYFRQSRDGLDVAAQLGHFGGLLPLMGIEA